MNTRRWCDLVTSAIAMGGNSFLSPNWYKIQIQYAPQYKIRTLFWGFSLIHCVKLNLICPSNTRFLYYKHSRYHTAILLMISNSHFCHFYFPSQISKTVERCQQMECPVKTASKVIYTSTLNWYLFIHKHFWTSDARCTLLTRKVRYI